MNNDHFIYDLSNYNDKNYPLKEPPKFCNNTKLNQQNRHIYNRNIPQNKLSILEDYRTNINICNKQVNSNLTIYKKKFNNRINNFNDIISTLEPGKGVGTTFLKNIDIDSKLKLLDNSLCINNKFKPYINCSSTTVNKPTLLPNGYCNNFKIYDFKDGYKHFQDNCISYKPQPYMFNNSSK